MLTIVNYGMGNLRSVGKAFETAGALRALRVLVTDSPDDISKTDILVVPGVGAFGDCIKNLQRLNLVESIKSFIQSGKPYFGICLGMQILFDASEESPGTPGLGILKGKVKRFPSIPGMKIPHIGWNRVQIKDGSLASASMYFVHSYYADPEDKSAMVGETEYGVKFCSMIRKDNIWATQFHPEKSQISGLETIKQFLRSC